MINGEPRILLDDYPNEILRDIITNSGINNLTKLLSRPSFLESNNNVKRAINNAISSYTYSNKATKPERLPNNWEQSTKFQTDFKTAGDFQMFDNYCVDEEMELDSKIYYELEDASDLIELQSLVSALKPSKTMKLQLHLDFTKCGCRFVDLAKLLSHMDHLSDRLKRFAIRGPEMTHIEGEVNLELFTNVEVLKITCLKVNGTFSNFHKLRELCFAPVQWQKGFLDISKLPSSLKCLEINTDDVVDSSCDGITFPSLEKISIKCNYDPVPPLVKKVIQFMTYRETTIINYSYDGCDTVDDFVSFVAEVAKENGFHLQSLSIQGAIENSLNLYPSDSLSLRFTENEQLTSLLKLPPTLRKLSITDNYYTEISKILDILPNTLEHLNLSANDGDWDEANTDFARFKRLKSLILSNTEIDSINNFTFPDSLEILDLSQNKLQNFHGSFHLKKLNLFGNHIKSSDFIERGLESSHVETLYLGYKMDFSGCYLPIQSLSLNRCNLSGVCQFGDKLVSLRMELCKIQEGARLIFPKLRFLSIVHCLNDTCDLELPNTVEEIDFSFNDFTVIPSYLGKVEPRVLKLDHNNLSKATLMFSTNSLEVLDLSSNRIEEVNLSFPKGSTNLKLLDLCGNQLKEISMESIGHNDKSSHNDLYELSLADNLLKEDQIAALIPKLPKSTQSLWSDRQTPKGPGNWLCNVQPQ